MSDAEEPQQSPGNTSNSRSRRWMFTINNPSIPAGVFPFTNDRDLVKYLVYQRECGDASSLPHNQGFCILKHAVTLNRLKKACNRAHFEIARGSLKQCIDYCTKDDTRISGPYRFGDEPKVGGSTVALDDLREGIKDGTLKSMRDVAEAHFGAFLRYRQSLDYTFTLYASPRSAPPAVYIYWGPTASGKTKGVTEWLQQRAELSFFFYSEGPGS